MFVIVWVLCYCVGGYVCNCVGCVCYFVGILFVILWGLCLLLRGSFVSYCVGVLFVIVWELCL